MHHSAIRGLFLAFIFSVFTAAVPAQAQVTNFTDDFEDGDLTGWTPSLASHWFNSVTNPISGSRSLKHSFSGVSSNDWISAAPGYLLDTNNTTWRFNLSYISGMDPSGNNKFWVMLMSDLADISSSNGPVNGYAAGINLVGSSDLLTLYRVTNGTAAAIITSGYDWNINATVGVEVTRSAAGLWELKHDGNGQFDALTSDGTVTDTVNTNTTAFGLVTVFSTTLGGVLRMDDVAIAQNLVAATNSPPVIVPVGNKTVTNGTVVAFNVVALDTLDNDLITLSASNLPGSATFTTVTNASGVTNTFNWNPVDVTGVFTTQFYAVDKDGASIVASVITSVNPPLQTGGHTPVWINEVSYDPALAGDTNEFIEVAGAATNDLTNFRIVLYNGANGGSYSPMMTFPAGAMGDEGCAYGAVSSLTTTGDVQNGPDALALVEISGGVTSLLQFLSYGGAPFTATNGPATGYLSINIGSQTNSDITLQLTGAGTNYADFTWTSASLSPGTLNTAAGQTISPCTPSSSPPTIQPIGNKFGTNNQAMAFDVVALDNIEADTIELSASNLPAGAVFNTVTNAGGVTNTFTWALTGPPGAYPVDFYAQDNDGISTQSIIVTVLDPPSITITNVNETVPYAVSSIEIGGTASTNVLGEFTWTNALTGGTGTIPASTAWSIPGIGLNVGANLITVRGSNQFSETTSANVTITRLQPQVNTACTNVIFFQGFEGADSWTINAGAGAISSEIGETNFPPSQRILSGASSWQVAGLLTNLDLASVSIAGYTGRQVSVRVSSIGVTSGQGADGGDHIRLFVSLDGGAFPGTADLDLAGNNNTRFGFWATNIFNVIAGDPNSRAAPQSAQSSNNYTYLNVILPETATSVALRVEAVNDNPNEVWCVDDISLIGCPSGGCTDCDNDGLEDAWEIAYFGNTTTATNANEDADADGFSNLEEFFARSIPTDFASKLQAESVTNSSATGFIVKWQSHTGATYVVARSTNILESFVGVASNIAATPPANTYTDAPAASGSRFYNVTVP